VARHLFESVIEFLSWGCIPEYKLVQKKIKKILSWQRTLTLVQNIDITNSDRELVLAGYSLGNTCAEQVIIVLRQV
jgi:hypothetical protein